MFTAASLACGFADNIYVLVALRAVQALGGGAFMPSATGIVADHFGRHRDRAVGMFTSIFPIGGIVGPILGGVFVTYSGVADDLPRQRADRAGAARAVGCKLISGDPAQAGRPGRRDAASRCWPR